MILSDREMNSDQLKWKGHHLSTELLCINTNDLLPTSKIYNISFLAAN